MKRPITSVICETGINSLSENMSWDEYKEVDAMNPSTLVHGLVRHDPWMSSMKHLKAAWDVEREDTDDLRWGRAIHCMLFEGKEFENRYVCWDGGRRTGKAWEEFQAENKGREILTKQQCDELAAAGQALISHPYVRDLISEGVAESTVLCQEGNIQCRGRLDWISQYAEHKIIDLKSTRSMHPARFGRDFYQLRYDIKLGLYQRWLKNVTGCHYPVEVITLEKRYPYDVGVFPIPDPVLEYGASKGLRLLAELEEAIDTNTWRGIGEYMFLDTPTGEMIEADLIFDD